VERISGEDYQMLVVQAKTFLSGKTSLVQKQLGEKMQAAAAAQKYEEAAAIRDRLRGLAHIQGNDVINPASLTDADVIALHQEAGQSCVQVFFIRGGRNNGNRSFFPTHAKGEEAPEILAAFIAQFYDDKPVPPVLLLSHAAAEQELLEQALSLKAERKISVTVPQRGEKHDVVAHAQTNAREALERRLAESAGQGKLRAATADLFALPEPPSRIEIYDNSHIMGTSAYGVMVVAGPEGFEKAAYRKFAIKSTITPGDDFGMMREVLLRRFSRAVAEGTVLPDLVLIDGGAGQFSAAAKVMEELGVTVPIVAIAKGPDRDAGREWFFTPGKEPFQLPPRDPVLYFLQRLRDEAHRFAITTHRNARSKKITVSELDEVPGIGAARKKALLTHFGAARGVKAAGLKDLEAVAGINKATARAVYAHFHPGVRMEEG
jgi:excinuclease ABC subunit C